MKKLLTILGTRPQFIKYAALADGLDATFDHVVVDTGQHWDRALAGAFLDEFAVRPPDATLGIGGMPALVQIGRMVDALHGVLETHAPDGVLCLGDTNSTLAAALSAARHGIPLAHIEAGERNRAVDGARVPPASIPEETNRVVADHLSSLLLCVSDHAARQLQSEAVTGRIVVTGDIMYDLYRKREHRITELEPLLARYGFHTGEYYFATMHRPINTDDRARLTRMLGMLSSCAIPVVLALHPRTEAMMRASDLYAVYENHPVLRLIPPVSHGESLFLSSRSRAVLTDSGGVMREAYFVGVPSVCLDDTTAWSDICDAGWSTVVGADESAFREALSRPAPAARPPLFGSGDAVAKTLDAMRSWLA
jgi:UDP-GlcNAc3NAcA epimerase